jgi:hypothetical protein
MDGKLIKVVVVAHSFRQIERVVKFVGLRVGTYTGVWSEEGLRGLEPGRLVVLREGEISEALERALNFYEQLGAVVLNIPLSPEG